MKVEDGVVVVTAEGAATADEDEGEEPIDMSFPAGGGWKKITIYIVTFPIMAPLFLTLPDTKNPKSEQQKGPD